MLEYIEYPHPRVRWSAANCLGEFCNSFFYLIEESKRNAVLDALLRLIKDTVPRVATHTVRCLTDFINADRTNVISAAGPLGPYKDRIIEGLKEFLSTHQTLRPQEEAMRTLIIIIRKLGRDFAPYYDPMMGYFQKVMSCVTSQEGRTLRGLALEAASLSGKVVGKERFEKDAKFVLGEMVKVNMTDHTDPQVGCVEAALCLFAEILGEDFAEFMPYVIPNVIASAGMDVPSQEVDMEDNDNDKDDDYYYEGDKIIRFYRGQAEDKAKHIQSLGVYAYSTRGKFIPYVEKSFAVVMESSKFKLCADVRREAFCTMEYLLRSTAIACMENNGNAALVNGLQKMIEIILNAALECASNSEEVWEVRLAGIRALKGTFSVMGGQLSLTPETAMRVAGTLGSKVLGPWAKDMLENEEPECDDDADSYYSVFGCVQECIDAVFQKQWVAFFPAYGMHLHPIVLSLLSMNTEDNYPAIALKVLCGVVKYSPKPLDGNLFNTILNAHLGLGTSEEGEILQEVCAGIEALAESHNPVFKQRLTEVRSAIMKIASMNIPQGMYDSGLYVAADMAVATLGVIIYNYGANQDFSDLGLFMLRIPLTSCREAGEKAHKLFCVFTQMFYARVMGQNYENVRIVISLLARIIETGFLKQEDRQVITSIVKDLAGKVDENVLVLDLTERLRNILRDFLQNN